MTRLTGVYHADGGLVGELRYLAGKLRGTAHCALCDITHGTTGKKAGFARCEAALGIPLELVHLNERSDALRELTAGQTPCVVAHTNEGLVMLLNAAALDGLEGSVTRFDAAVREALTRLGA